MRQRRICWLCLCVWLLSCLPVQALAADTHTGDFGGGFHYTLTGDGQLTVSGSGQIPDLDQCPWYAMREQVQTAILEPGITAIGTALFQGCTQLQTLYLPATLGSIHAGALLQCNRLQSVCFAGTRAQWEQVEIAPLDNESLLWFAHVSYRTDARAEHPESPYRLAIARVPGADEKSICGCVYTEDGSDFQSGDYRVSVYLQVPGDTSWYQKPFADTPYTDLQEDGSFEALFCTGGNDLQAEAFWVLLIPSAYFPTADLAATQAVALDRVYISRTDGSITPERQMPTARPAQIAIDDAPTIASQGKYIQGHLYAPTQTQDWDPTAYRIALYLQLTPGGTRYVKPTYAMPYTEISADGSFSALFASATSDLQAQVLTLLVVPRSYTPGDYLEALSQAVDLVRIVRSTDTIVDVYPKRTVPEDNPTQWRRTGLTVSEQTIAMNVGFHIDGSSPGAALDETLIRRQLLALRSFVDTVRFYDCSDERVYRIAQELGFSIIATAWLSGDTAENQRQLDELVRLTHCYDAICLACVGSEVILRGDLTVQALIDDLNYVRAGLSDTQVPVTTADSVDVLQSWPSLRAACDVLYCNIYPYWAGVSEDAALGAFQNSLEALCALARGKEVIVSEAGHPTEGQSVQQAVASGECAGAYFEALQAYSLTNGIKICFFEGADEPWKSQDEGACGAHWGFLDTSLHLKDCYAQTDFFQNIHIPETCVISYAPGRGSGEMASIVAEVGQGYVLPTCSCTPPTGYAFSSYLLGDARYAPGDTIYPTQDTVLSIQWLPQVVFAATGPDRGILSGVTAGMLYRIGGGVWTEIRESGFLQLTGLSPCTIEIRGPDTDETLCLDLTRAATPSLPVQVFPAYSVVPTTVDYEISYDGETWTACTGATRLSPGHYAIRQSASGQTLASDAQILDISPCLTAQLTDTSVLYTARLSGVRVLIAWLDADAHFLRCQLPADLSGSVPRDSRATWVQIFLVTPDMAPVCKPIKLALS